MSIEEIENTAAAFIDDSALSTLVGPIRFSFGVDDYTGMPLVTEWEPFIIDGHVTDGAKKLELGTWLGEIAALNGIDAAPQDIWDTACAIGRLARARQFEEGCKNG
jgi:hypothetical protein